MLIVRLSGATAPKTWNRWGQPLNAYAPNLWGFPLPTTLDLADLVAALVMETPDHLLQDCLAVWVKPDFDGRLPWSVLEELEPLSVMYTRLHEPWIMGSLGHLLRPHFQPVVDLRETGQLLGYQMSCHLEHPERGRISDRELLQIARYANRLEAVEQTCQINALLRRSETLPRGVLAFIAARQRALLDLDLERHPAYTCLERLALQPADIVIDLTHSAEVHDIEPLVLTCSRLRRAGFRLALGEFSRGITTLNLLEQIEPDFLRLDRGLVQSAQQRPALQDYLAGLLGMVHHFGVATWAEGVDAAADLQLCRDLGIRYGQGEMIGSLAPVPVVPASLPDQCLV